MSSFLKLRRFAALALMLILSTALTFAQGIGGSILGKVVDQSGVGIGGFSVNIVNQATGQQRSATTDLEGRFEARELPPGLYEVTITQSGYKTAVIKDVKVGVGQNARLQTVPVDPIPAGTTEVIEVRAEVALLDPTTPTLSTSFTEKQITELPILSRDINNLALLAPGVFSVRSFSFASTLVPFAANGSRGRDNNFIIDSVDNNEPLFGGAAAQFTNTDLFAEYRILTNQYKAEYGRNSGSVVNIVTERGGNNWRGSLFWFGQHDNFNATTSAQRVAQVQGGVRYYENQIGGTLGGPIKEGSSWVFASYQWDRAREDLSAVYPQVATLPTPAGLSALQSFQSQLCGGVCPTVQALLSLPSVTQIPQLNAPCGQATSGLPPTNPCTIGTADTAGFFFGGTNVPVDFGTYLVPGAGVFDVRDHQASIRWDQRLSNRDDIYVRYLFDDLFTPRTVGSLPQEVAFTDFGLLPEFNLAYKQRTQSLGLFWTRAGSRTLHELRASYTRIASLTGPLGAPREFRESLPAMTVAENDLALFTASGGTGQGTANFLAAFPAAGRIFTIGRETRPARINSNLFQVQDNVSMTRGNHGVKFGVNIVRTQSNIRHMPSDLGQYLYGGSIPIPPMGAIALPGFEFFANNFSLFGSRRFPNFLGSGGDVLPLREFAHFYFFQDDWQIAPNFMLSYGLRYENYGQVINSIREMNPAFGKVDTDRNNFAPRLGFAWSWSPTLVLRGGYGFFYNPTVFNIPLLAWQSGPISPLVNRFLPPFDLPELPFRDANVTERMTDCDTLQLAIGGPVTWLDCSHQDRIVSDFHQAYVQNFSLSLQKQMGTNFLVELSYVGSKGTGLYQRLNENPNTGWDVGTNCLANPLIGNNFGQFACRNGRENPLRGSISAVTNGASSTYHALQVSTTRRYSGLRGFGDVAFTAAYTWSHMIDNASEIFGPGVRRAGNILNLGLVAGSDQDIITVEAITPFSQDPNNAGPGERGNSSFDRRHRLAISSIWTLPSPAGRGARLFFGDWQLNSFFTVQSGQPFSPLNSFGNCEDSLGDGIPTNDRPNLGNAQAPLTTVALINNTLCLDPRDSGNPAIAAAIAANEIVAGAGFYITPAGVPANLSNVRFIQVGRGHLGNAGRNILIGPNQINLDLALFKTFWLNDVRRLQFRLEAYNVFNRANPGSTTGNVFSTSVQGAPGFAFAPVGPQSTPARVLGIIPENSIDALDPITGDNIFLSRRYMNTSSRRLQFAVKYIF